MKIAFLLNHLHAGGAERVVVTLSNQLASEGYDVTIMLTRKHGSYLTDVDRSVKLVELGGKRMAGALPKLIREISKNNYDAVISGLDQPNVALGLASLLIPSKTKYIFTEHTHPIRSNAGVKSKLTKLVRKLKPFLYRRADHIICVNMEARSVIIEKFLCDPKKVTTIHNPVDLKQVEKLASEPANHPWLINKTSYVICAAGRLVHAKDYNTLLEAMSFLRKDTNVKLIIMGEGELRPELERKIKNLHLSDCVDLYGFSSNPFAMISRSDCFVMSSRTEGLPTVLVEALALGKKIVSTNCPSGPAEILENGKFGRLVEIENPIALSVAIKSTLDSESDTDDLVKRSLNFSPEIVAKNYMRLVNSLNRYKN